MKKVLKVNKLKLKPFTKYGKAIPKLSWMPLNFNIKKSIGSYILKEEDTIEIRDKSKQLAFIDIALANKEREAPEYIQLDEKNKKVKFIRTPKFEEVPYPVVMEPNLVIEYYSR